MTMKKWMTGLLCLGLLTMTACGGPAGQTQETPPVQETPAGPSEDGQPTTETDTQSGAGDGNVLVVYYSATGSTEAVAGYISEALEADIFEIVPAQVYTSDDLDWTNANSRVSREHDDPALRTMELASGTADNWDSYDTVLIGYPIWWGAAAWPVDNFVAANDFTGKTVIPFCTSASSGLGESGELLAKLAGTGNWLEGQRFRSGVSQSDVQSWVQSLDLPK